MVLLFVGRCACCVLMLYRCGTRVSWCSLCARSCTIIFRILTCAVRDNVERVWNALAAARSAVLGRAVAHPCIACGTVRQAGRGHIGTRNGHHSGPHGSRKLVAGLPEPHETRMSLL